LAAPLAYEQPTLNKTWKAVLDRISTIPLIWLTSALISGIGVAVCLPFNNDRRDGHQRRGVGERYQ